MTPRPALRSIIHARIDVIPHEMRPEAFARLSRSLGAPALRSVGAGERYAGDPEENDIVLGLFARVGCSSGEQLSGVLAIRERERPITTAGIKKTVVQDRLFLIEAMTLSDDMLHWLPPIPALLAATAATLIGTVRHEPASRTQVALRLASGDRLMTEAASLLGGRRAAHRVDLAAFGLGGVVGHELQFLEQRDAITAARLVADVMEGRSPTRPGSSPESAWNRELRVIFPRTFRHMYDEIALLSTGQVSVGWQLLPDAGNDDGLELGIAVGAGRG